MTQSRNKYSKILVTGANGHIGFNLVKTLHEEGHEGGSTDVNRVGKVVLTSSIVTLPTVKPGAPLADQTSWRTDLSVPYMRAKTEAEKFAWKLAEEKNTNLATVLTCVIIGPNFGGGTPTTDMIQVMKMGSMRMGTIDNIYQILDVREVVTAHILAAKKDVTGNFIVGADNEPVFVEVLDAMRRIDPKVPKAMMIVPKLFYPKLPAFDWLSNKMMGTPRTMTRELIESIGDTNMLANNQKAKDEFGWSQNVDLETSLRE